MTSPPPAPDLRRVAARLRTARRVLVLTGAGVSAESGIPTFRGAGGWWRNEDPTQLATQAAFDRDPVHVWEWYQYRRGLVADAAPNPGHHALARLERGGGPADGPAAPTRRPEVLLVTQNVDDLHERAGSPDPVHVHGSLWRVRCERCGREREDRTHPFDDLPPHCSGCGGVLRPAVVWFNEMLPRAPLARVDDFLARGPIDVALVVGTEATFGYIRGWALRARAAGALLVEVNPTRTGFSDAADVRLPGEAGVILPSLVQGSDPPR